LNRLDTDAIIEAQFGSRRRARTETSFSSCQPAGNTDSPKALRWLPWLKKIFDEGGEVTAEPATAPVPFSPPEMR